MNAKYNEVRVKVNNSNHKSALVANERATFLSLQSTNDEIRKYFIAVLNLSKSKEKYPVNLDDVWMLVYGRKQEAVRALTSEIFIQDIDYQLLRQKCAKTQKAADLQ